MIDETKAVTTITTEKSLDQLRAEVQNLNQFYTGIMQKGTDYDTIPGTPKPTLLKSGAEMLRMRFGFNPEFKISKGLTDIQKGFIEYDVTCSLLRDGTLFAEGVGNANSLESKWRYRWVWPTDLPKDFDKTKAYETYGATRKTKQGGTQYRIDNENPQDQANTILKIAKKRAFVDAILTATGASRIFTQDVEDMGILSTADSTDAMVESLEDGVNPAAKSPADGMCPEHNTAWVDGKFGLYHWTEEIKNGKKVSCSKAKVDKKLADKSEAMPNATQKEVEPQPEALQSQPGGFKERLNIGMKLLGWKNSDLFEHCNSVLHFGLEDLQDLPMLSNENKDTLLKSLSELVDLKDNG